MKFQRSCKIYFSKYLTDSKKSEVKEYLSEMHNMIQYGIEHHEQEMLKAKSKFDLFNKKFHNEGPSWLLGRARRHAYAEAYALVTGDKNSALELGTKYSTPKHNPNQVQISDIDIRINTNPELKEFDLLIEIRCFDSRSRGRTIVIPLKKNELFNKWISKGKINNAVIITDKYIQFSFECEVEKKESGAIAGFDPGAKNTLTDSNGNHYGSGLWALLTKINRKKRYSKAYYRAREEIREYIDRTCKSIGFDILKLLVLEDNTNIKHKSKVKGRLTKNMRSFLASWTVGRIDNRIEMLCEENGVRLRRVPAFYNSTKCPICGHCEKANRASQEEFKCVECGHTMHADVVGALNSLARFALGPYGAECKHEFMLKHPDYGSKILGSLRDGRV